MKDGWVAKTLAEVSAIRYGYTESASSDAIGPRFLRITDIQDDCVDWEHRGVYPFVPFVTVCGG
jgi:type I restriction enzyme S subunit